MKLRIVLLLIGSFLLSHPAACCGPRPRNEPQLLDTVFGAIDDLSKLPVINLPTKAPTEDASILDFNYPEKCDTPACVRSFLKYYDRFGTSLIRRYDLAWWNFVTNLTDVNEKKSTAVGGKYFLFIAENTEYAQKLSSNGLTADEKRQLKLIATYRDIPPRKENARKYARYTSRMSFIYGKATIILKNGTKLPSGESGVVDFFQRSRDYDALTEVWKKWRLVTGKKIKDYFLNATALKIAAGRRLGYKDIGHQEWFSDFDDPRFNEKVMDWYAEVLPLYKELHAYVRFKLHQKYRGRFDPKGPIPAHILGNTWAQDWQNIFDLVKPYPNAASADITQEMRNQNWTVTRMFKTAEEFFISLGLPKMTKEFWERSMLTKPKDRSVNCHGSAHDFGSKTDFRIKMCTVINHDMLQTVHHEMGHIAYDMLYAHLPLIYRRDPNSGFHEAIGDTIGLSFETNKHLFQIGLMKELAQSKESSINYLMRMSLYKVAFLPFAIMMDSWRWRVLNGSITSDTYNQGWWRLRRDLQGLKPPIPRRKDDFDPGAKYHVANNIPYIRYYVAYIIQFQFYEAMCNVSGHTGPLHQCDFYRSKEAGNLLRSVLSLGRSKPWPEAMQIITGQPNIRITSMLRYFQPLFTWLKNYRKEHNYPIGWQSASLVSS